MESTGTDRGSEIAGLVEYVKKITFLYSLDHRDWNAKVINVIRIWLINSKELVLTIFYDCDVLTGCLGFPVASVIDLCYFIRTSKEIISIHSFHDMVNFGTVQDDVDGCLLKILELIYAPIFRNFMEWGDNVKQRFCTSLDKFLGILTAIYFKMSGMTVLYVPYVVKEIAKEISSYDREFVKNLECIAVSWATLIRILLNDKTLTSPNEYISVGDEFEFWLYRCKSSWGAAKWF
ncbi:dynein heavy chain 2, axonemal-like isoform X1 [Drosophila mauritiana]|uniref:Dynein heavy chain 2, axonemal-like isoform X1 n=1 Tax=Drosophila mauritiana TaxID=7226 RepID=A0A6P8LDR2_DROMA|nr:dynein heavy chain 2, axonemal-like isoform X1 [Drosophila mauritiana]